MLAGEILESKYRLLRPLQTAWLAVAQGSGQKCLLKPQTGFTDPQVAVWLGQVRHSGLPRLLGELSAPAAESCWIFEYIEGQSFRELALASGGRLPVDRLLPLITQVARILAFAHDQDGQAVVHLDIKPENLLLTEDGMVALIDFGAARMIPTIPGQRPTTCVPADGNTIALTLEYAAPELLAGHPGVGSDVYALALTLLHLLTGYPAAECRSRPLPEVLATVPELPVCLQSLIGRCLHTDPENRLISAVELACALATAQLQSEAAAAADVPAVDVGIQLLEPALLSDLPLLPAGRLPPTAGTVPDTLSPPLLPAAPEPAIPQADQSGLADEPIVPLICVWDGAELGCELAAVLAEQRQVLVIDADLLNPQADLLLGVATGMGRTARRNDRNSLDQVLVEEQRGLLDIASLNQLIEPSQVSQVRVLTTGCGLDQYEYFQMDALHQILLRARLTSDLIIVLCSQFIFDAFTCLCLQAADLVLVPLAGDSGAFRKFNRAVEFLATRQQFDPSKLKYVAFAYDHRLDLSWGTMDELCGGRLLGSISACDRRRRMKSGAAPYAAALARLNRQEYLSLIQRINLQNLRKKVNA